MPSQKIVNNKDAQQPLLIKNLQLHLSIIKLPGSSRGHHVNPYGYLETLLLGSIWTYC